MFRLIAGTILSIGFGVGSKSVHAGCVSVREGEYREMQKKLLLDNATAGRVNETMSMRSSYCAGQCQGDSSEGLCILVPDAEEKPSEVAPPLKVPKDSKGMAKAVANLDYNSCTDYCAKVFQTKAILKETCYKLCEGKD